MRYIHVSRYPCLCTHMWRAEQGTDSLPLVFFALYDETGYLAEPAEFAVLIKDC